MHQDYEGVWFRFEDFMTSLVSYHSVEGGWMMVKRGANETESVVRTRGAGFLRLMQRAKNVGSENVYFF